MKVEAMEVEMKMVDMIEKLMEVKKREVIEEMIDELMEEIKDNGSE